MKIIDDSRAFMAGLRERLFAKRAEAEVKEAVDFDVTLARLAGFGVVFAGLVEWVWAIIFCIESTGHAVFDIDMKSGTGLIPSFEWEVGLALNVVVFVGLVLATIPIVIWSMIWLPMQIRARGTGRWRRISMVVAGLLANLLIIVSGTVVMNGNRQEKVRDELVVEQTAAQGVRALEARRDAIKERWETLTASSNTTLQAQAARAGVAGWDSYIATARQQVAAGTTSPARLALIERARGSAVAAEEYQRQMDDLTAQIASAPTQAAVAANVEDRDGAAMNAFATAVEVYRPPFIALACTIIGILGAFWLSGIHAKAEARVGAPESAAPPEPQATAQAVPPDTTVRRVRQTRLRAPTPEELEAWRREIAGIPPIEEPPQEEPDYVPPEDPAHEPDEPEIPEEPTSEPEREKEQAA